MDTAELTRATALVRYGIALAPDTFSAFVRPVDDRFELVGLPAKGDPMRERITRIRESEYLFVDAVDEAYNEVLINIVTLHLIPFTDMGPNPESQNNFGFSMCAFICLLQLANVLGCIYFMVKDMMLVCIKYHRRFQVFKAKMI